jgi:hypothetical protein
MRVLFLIDAAIRPASPPYYLVRTISPPVTVQPLMSGIYFLLFVTDHKLRSNDREVEAIPKRHIALLPILSRPQLRRPVRLLLSMITYERRG